MESRAEITSRANPRVRHLAKLAASRAYRAESGEFVCDGEKLLFEAVRSGLSVRFAAFCAPKLARLEAAYSLCRERQIPFAVLSESAFSAVKTVDTPQGVLFSTAIPAPQKRLLGARFLVLDGLQDPGNVGTILRTADAFGADGVYVCGGADLFSPKTVRAAMGSLFRVPFAPVSYEELFSALDAENIPLYAAALYGETRSLAEIPLARAAVAIGNEGSGVSAAVLARAGAVRIEMTGRAESLNAAAAAAVILWEMQRRRE